jgi:hypothetical protein
MEYSGPAGLLMILAAMPCAAATRRVLRLRRAYGRDPASGAPLRGLEVIDNWLGDRLRREPEREGAFRVIYIEQQTGPFSRKAVELIARHLASADPARAASLSHRYRVEVSAVQHSQIARYCQPRLLAASDARFNWLE